MSIPRRETKRWPAVEVAVAAADATKDKVVEMEIYLSAVGSDDDEDEVGLVVLDLDDLLGEIPTTLTV